MYLARAASSGKKFGTQKNRPRKSVTRTMTTFQAGNFSSMERSAFLDVVRRLRLGAGVDAADGVARQQQLAAFARVDRRLVVGELGDLADDAALRDHGVALLERRVHRLDLLHALALR